MLVERASRGHAPSIATTRRAGPAREHKKFLSRPAAISAVKRTIWAGKGQALVVRETPVCGNDLVFESQTIDAPLV
jgi:hypothetical protein